MDVTKVNEKIIIAPPDMHQQQPGEKRLPIINKAALFFFALLPGLAFGQTQNYGPALPPDVIELRAEGDAALYNLDYATARSKYEEIRRRVPHHPTGDLYL